MSNPRKEAAKSEAESDADTLVTEVYPDTEVPFNHFYGDSFESIYGQDWSILDRGLKAPVPALRDMAMILENAYRDQFFMMAQMESMRKEIEYLRSQKVVNTHFGPIG